MVGDSADEGFLPAMANGGGTGDGSQEGTPSLGIGSASPVNGTGGSSSDGSGSSGQPASAPSSSTWTGRESRDAHGVEDAANSVAIKNSATVLPTIPSETCPGARTPGAESEGATSAVELAEGKVSTDANGLSLDISAPEENVPAPTHADILTNFLPIDRASLETAIDHILENFDGLGAGLADLKVLEGLALPVATGTVVFLGTEAVLSWRKRAAGREGSEENEDPILHPLLGLLV